MNGYSYRKYSALAVIFILVTGVVRVYAGGDEPSEFTNVDSIINTRHNMTFSTMKNGTGGQMNAYRNDYGEVCVYCHTPHGANRQIDAPLWNRTFLNTTYTTYDTLGTSSLKGDVTQPGVNSLTCLSCHDGTTAIDSIINMPGSGQYSALQETTQNESFLDNFVPPVGNPGFQAGDHYSLNSGTTFGDRSCLVCHNPSGPSDAGDFSVAVIGTDLTNDHPIGVSLPTSLLGTEFNEPANPVNGIRFYDTDGDQRPDSNEIRFYDTGQGPEVECASCHDPHGVPTIGSSGPLNPTFLRISNANSQICLTCHIK